MGLSLKLGFVILCIATSTIYADVSHILADPGHETTTPQPPPQPYFFSYSAGRTPDTIDRTHTEVSDGTVVRGKFSFIDPRQEVRAVEYIADKNGFHPQLSHAIVDTEANQLATVKHLKLYKEIAEAHAKSKQNVGTYSAPVSEYLQQDSEAVILEKEKHLKLFDQIAEEHAQIGAIRKAERKAFEATSEQNKVDLRFGSSDDFI